MKVSRNWLQNFFDAPLPDAHGIADALTFHVAEVEDIEQHDSDAVLDVKVLPDRAAYLLSHRGIAAELSAILEHPLKLDPIRGDIPEYPKTEELQVEIEQPEKCLRFTGALVRGVQIGPSPAWLKEALEAVGQRSINNVVDATNLVMFNTGQPMHAFDASKLQQKDGQYRITVRGARAGEQITTLSGDEYALPADTILITDGNADQPIGIAGIKGGKAAEVTNETTDLIIEAANFDGTAIRRASQSLKLFTDASLRFQNRPSPELVPYGMRQMLSLLETTAGGTLVGVTDVYPDPAKAALAPVSVTLDQIQSVLGLACTAEQVANVFDRLGLPYTKEGDTFCVTPPFERRDLSIPEDLIEEVGRIIGYDAVPAVRLAASDATAHQDRYCGIERIKDFLAERGFTEVSTQSFAEKGDVYLANPLDQSKPALRSLLLQHMQDALARAVLVAPRVLGVADAVKLFEIGTVFVGNEERLSLSLGYRPLGKKPNQFLNEVVADLQQQVLQKELQAPIDSPMNMTELNLSLIDLETIGNGYEPKRIRLGMFQPFSIYPFALRDIAVWTPAGTQQDEVENRILKEAGELLVRIDLFDRFEKDDRISYAFRLVFESSERTLSDEDLNPTMERVTDALNAQENWQVR